jgi:hypothetical protein
VKALSLSPSTTHTHTHTHTHTQKTQNNWKHSESKTLNSILLTGNSLQTLIDWKRRYKISYSM